MQQRTIVLESERLLLAEAALADAPFIFELLNSPGWLAHIGDRGIRALADAEAYIEDSLLSSYRSNGFGMYLMLLKPDGPAVGLCGLLKRAHLDFPDIGFAILPDYEGKGLTTEAGRAIWHDARNRLGYTRLYGITSFANKGSQQVLQKIGLSPKGTTQMSGQEEAVMLLST